MTSDPSVSLSDEYFVDHCIIDKQHAEIYALLTNLSAGHVETGELQTAGFEHLLQLIEKHFTTEERLAKKATVPFTEHAKVHNDNLQQMKDSFELVRDGLADTTALLRYIDFWFLRHIVQFDKPFALELKAVSSKQAIR